MSRRVRLAFGLAFFTLLVSARHAGAQYFYPGGMGNAGGGWGGWGSTVQGDTARGMGAYAAGAGVYNYQTAQARAVNANTLMNFNEYLYQSQQVANRRYAARTAAQSKTQIDAYNARQATLRDNPSQADIFRGDALNVLVDQISNPRFSRGSSLGKADLKVPGKIIRNIPFFFSTDAVVIGLSQLVDETSWPRVLRSDSFAAERRAYIGAVKALADDEKKPEELANVRSSLKALFDKVDATIPKTQMPDYSDAMGYLKGLAGLAKMMEKPNFEKALKDLDPEKQATIGQLLAFMANYNLRFGAANTPEQRTAYTTLYPMLASQVNRLVADAPPAVKLQPSETMKAPAELFKDVDAKHLNPQPPAPGTP